jgi:hypothetical protein
MIFLSVDLQREFTEKSGKFTIFGEYRDFITSVFVPYLSLKEEKVLQIISDYRLPRLNGSCSYCIPGTDGYGSILHPKIVKSTWVKASRNPVWIRRNSLPLQLPQAHPDLFSDWLENECPLDKTVVLLGVALECCVFTTIQELYFRGYKIYVLSEAVECTDGTQDSKHFFFDKILPLWGEVVHWEDLLKKFV